MWVQEQIMSSVWNLLNEKGSRRGWEPGEHQYLRRRQKNQWRKLIGQQPHYRWELRMRSGGRWGRQYDQLTTRFCSPSPLTNSSALKQLYFLVSSLLLAFRFSASCRDGIFFFFFPFCPLLTERGNGLASLHTLI